MSEIQTLSHPTPLADTSLKPSDTTIPGGIYIVLLKTPDNTGYSWNIYFAQTTTLGILCKQQAGNPAEVKNNHNLIADHSFRVGCQIYKHPLNDGQMVGVIDVVRQVECRNNSLDYTWVQDTLLRLMAHRLIPKLVPEPGVEDEHSILKKVIPEVTALTYQPSNDGRHLAGRIYTALPPREELSPYTRAAIAIKSTNPSALDHSHLTGFMLKSDSMVQGPQFILDRISAAGGDVSASHLEGLLKPFSFSSSSMNEAVRAVKEDLMVLAEKFSSNEPPVNADIDAALRERDANRCVVTGQDIPHQGRLRELLEASIGKDLTSRLFDYLDRSSSVAGEERLKNMWLMAPDVRERFVNGHITMGRAEYAPRQVSKS
ncbi:hypothetical protein FQN50_005717 [Emmonsiellopsis sp. PD_5]|nr:hypothetical protein FQN50_005717 [Emmonsiellopsis sp. PD_5]